MCPYSAAQNSYGGPFSKSVKRSLIRSVICVHIYHQLVCHLTTHPGDQLFKCAMCPYSMHRNIIVTHRREYIHL